MKGSPAFHGTFLHCVTCMVTMILRLEPAVVRNGAGGVDFTDSPAYGWLIRVTVTGGPASTVSSTPRLKLRLGAPSGVGSQLR